MDLQAMTEAEREAREATTVVLDEQTQVFVDQIVSKLMIVCDELSGHPLYEYQQPFARRMFESLIINDGAVLSLLMSRQSGKSETVADVVATAMIMLPRLSKAYPDLLDKYKEGLWVGAFAPVDDQADTLFKRIVDRLSSKQAEAILADPEINDKVMGKGKLVWLKNCESLVRRTTCHPRATIEGKSYHLILVDEAQGADAAVIDKSVVPMGAAYNATMCMTGTPTYTAGIFYKQIQQNKREYAAGTIPRQNHFEVDWREAAKANPNYARFVKGQMLRMGEDSDEFKLSFRIMWLLDKGMFTTSQILSECGIESQDEYISSYSREPVVVGIDCARIHDSTVVTVLGVDWERPDDFGFLRHHVLAWLDLNGMEWEDQYYAIAEFLSSYRVLRIGIDVNGMGGPVKERLERLMPGTDFVEVSSSQAEQSERWKYLRQLLGRRLVTWPAGDSIKQTKTYRRFISQMEDLQLKVNGPYLMAEAPRVKDAHDDYPDSLSIATLMTSDEVGEELAEVEVFTNVFYQRGR